jgi:hypothetical protein
LPNPESTPDCTIFLLNINVLKEYIEAVTHRQIEIAAAPGDMPTPVFCCFGTTRDGQASPHSAFGLPA